MKLWDARSSECVNTWEAHEDKVWAMDTVQDGVQVLSGGGDGRVVVWDDCTEEDTQEAAAAEAARLHQEQEMLNALDDGRVLEAARIAFALRQPGRLLRVVQQVVAGGCVEESARVLGSIVQGVCLVGVLRVCVGCVCVCEGGCSCCWYLYSHPHAITYTTT